MKIKVKQDFRDRSADLALRKKGEVLDVSEQRARELTAKGFAAEVKGQKDPTYVPETEISGKQAFRLYDTYGFPLELTEELAAEEGLTVDAKGFAEAFKEPEKKTKSEN